MMSPQKILIADDSFVFARVLSLWLKAKGYQVLTAADGASAISTVRQEKPDLILLDINFPPDVGYGGNVGWDGFRIMEWLVRMDEANGVPIIIITAGDLAKEQARCRAFELAGFFHKPFNNDDLLASIREALQGKTRVEPPASEKLSAPAESPAAVVSKSPEHTALVATKAAEAAVCAAPPRTADEPPTELNAPAPARGERPTPAEPPAPVVSKAPASATSFAAKPGSRKRRTPDIRRVTMRGQRPTAAASAALGVAKPPEPTAIRAAKAAAAAVCAVPTPTAEEPPRKLNAAAPTSGKQSSPATRRVTLSKAPGLRGNGKSAKPTKTPNCAFASRKRIRSLTRKTSGISLAPPENFLPG